MSEEYGPFNPWIAARLRRRLVDWCATPALTIELGPMEVCEAIIPALDAMPESITRAGPFVIRSKADGTLILEPQWGEFPVYDEDDGGGPPLGARLALAADLERWLNAGAPPRP